MEKEKYLFFWYDVEISHVTFRLSLSSTSIIFPISHCCRPSVTWFNQLSKKRHYHYQKHTVRRDWSCLQESISFPSPHHFCNCLSRKCSMKIFSTFILLAFYFFAWFCQILIVENGEEAEKKNSSKQRKTNHPVSWKSGLKGFQNGFAFSKPHIVLAQESNFFF